MSHPLVVRQRVAQAATSPERLVAGIAALLAGHVRLARESLRQVQADSDSTDTVRMMASVATAMSSVLGDEEVAVEPLDRAVDEAERMGLWWLARLGHDALSSIDETNRGAPPPPDAAAYDPWGPALGNFLYCWGEVRRGAGDTRRLEAIAATFRRLDAPVLEVWSRALCAVVAVRQGRSEGRDIALQAEALARAVGVDGAQALALLALAEANPETCDPTLAAAMADRLGLRLPGPIGPVGCTGGRTSTRAPLVITCLSAFSFTVRGRRLDLGAAKPRVRSLLRLLSLYAGRPVHREVIAEALWPEVDCESGTRSLQVAVSALRQLLEPGVARSASSLVLRDGEAYRLGLPKGSSIDILDFDDLATRGRTAWLTGDAGAAVAALGGALDLYRGELLPEEGPAEWVVKERERLCSTAVEAAATLALVYERDRNATACASACERGLSIDRYRDCLWRRLIDVHTAAGDFASAARARRGYAAVLAELGITDGAPEGRGVVGVDRRFLWRAAG
jgi:DNA-binding SARP family transcriptional activator